MNSFIRILAYLKPYLLSAFLAPLLMLVEVAMDLAQPRLMQNIVDIGIAHMNHGYIIHMGLLMIGAALIGLLGGAGCTLFSTLAGVHMGTDLRQSVFRKVQTLSFPAIDTIGTGSLITRLTSDIAQIQEIVIMMLRILVRAPLLILGSLIMAVLLSPKLSLILIILIPFLIISIAAVMYYSFPLFASVQKRFDGLNSVIQENISGIRVIKAFARENYEHKRFAKTNNELLDMMKKASITIAVIYPIMILLLNGGIALVLYYGGHLTAKGALTAGKLIAYINYLMQLLMSLMLVSMMLIRFSRSEASAGRIMEILDQPPELVDSAIPEIPGIVRGEVVFENVSFTYGNEKETKPVLNTISFTLHPGKTTAIIGTTGSGKSTIVSLLPRMYEISSGTIRIDGINTKKIPIQELRSYIGVVPQQQLLFSGTIRDNIAYGVADATEESILRAADIAQIKDFINTAEKGLDTELHQRGVNLSGGQKQRISIARALLMNPPILIMDDSSSALDAGTAAKLQKSLCEFRTHGTTLIIAQRIASVMQADTIIVLDEGKIIDQGTHETLLKHCALYREIALLQLGEEVLHG